MANRMTGRVGRRGKPSMAILVALLMALVALPLLMVPDTLSMPGSNGVDRGAALSLPRPCFSRSVFESCIPLAASPPMSTTLIYRVC